LIESGEYGMSTAQQAFITSEVLSWARERLGETIESAAHKLKIEPNTLRSSTLMIPQEKIGRGEWI
jgi:hypothetical protein